MEFALVVSAALMGLAGAPHCAAMCGAACAGVVHGCSAATPATGGSAFAVGRLLGYASAGAVAASAVSMLGTLGESATALRALWSLMHAGAFGLGLWLMVTARQPAWMKRVGTAPARLQPTAARWQRVSGPMRTGATGVAWVALPCGLLQSAIVVAALADSAAGGAAAMSAFALTSATGLAAVPLLTLRAGGTGTAGLLSSGWAVRLAGVALAGASAWALGHGLWQRVVAICTS